MYSDTQLRQEVAEIVNGNLDRETIMSAESVTLQICETHIPEFVRGRSYVEHCAWIATRKIVGDYMARKFKDEDGNIQQMRLPGFAYVQRAYVVEANGDQVAIPTRKLTAEQVVSIISRLRQEGKQKLAHAHELSQYYLDTFGSAQMS